jgi:hypothetical protein
MGPPVVARDNIRLKTLMNIKACIPLSGHDLTLKRGLSTPTGGGAVFLKNRPALGGLG